MKTYEAGVTYAPGTVVLHNDKLYRKLNDGDNSPPDDVLGGWVELPKDQTNLPEYLTVEAALNSYEAKREAHQNRVYAAIKAAGLELGDVLVTLEAGAAAGEVTR